MFIPHKGGSLRHAIFDKILGIIGVGSSLLRQVIFIDKSGEQFPGFSSWINRSGFLTADTLETHSSGRESVGGKMSELVKTAVHSVLAEGFLRTETHLRLIFSIFNSLAI